MTAVSWFFTILAGITLLFGLGTHKFVYEEHPLARICFIVFTFLCVTILVLFILFAAGVFIF